MSSQADRSSPAPWQVAETISDTMSEPRSQHDWDLPSISGYRDTLSGRWGSIPSTYVP